MHVAANMQQPAVTNGFSSSLRRCIGEIADGQFQGLNAVELLFGFVGQRHRQFEANIRLDHACESRLIERRHVIGYINVVPRIDAEFRHPADEMFNNF